MKSLGVIETRGWVAAIQAVDAACKAAGVTCIGYRKPGSGLVSVCFEGEISAIHTARERGVAVAGAEHTGHRHHLAGVQVEIERPGVRQQADVLETQHRRAGGWAGVGVGGGQRSADHRFDGGVKVDRAAEAAGVAAAAQHRDPVG